LPFRVCGSGVCQKRRASAVSQLPSLTLNFLGPLTRRMLAANSGLSKPAYAASYASRRTAASRPLIVAARAAVLEENAKVRNHYFVKGKSWLRTIPLNKLIDGMSVSPFGLWRTQTVEYPALLWSRSGRPSFDFGRFELSNFRPARLLIPAASSAAGESLRRI
jgi:hypothetical protein